MVSVNSFYFICLLYLFLIDDSDDLSFITDSSDDDDLSSRNSQSEDQSEEQITLEEINSQTTDLA
jgi:hypothetical protein